MSNNLRTRNGMPFNFVNGLKVRGMDIESLIPGIEGIPEAGSKYQFAGNGSNKAFTLPVSPYNKDAVDVYVKQLYVHPDDYTLVGDTITLTEAPPALVAGETYNVVIKVNLTTLNGYVNASRVSFEGENLDDILEKGKPLANYSNLRAYAGAATQVRITDPGIAGFFYYDATDTSSADNGGTIIVSSNGRRWKRAFDNAINVSWFGATSRQIGAANAIAITSAINFSLATSPHPTIVFNEVLDVTGQTIIINKPADYGDRQYLKLLGLGGGIKKTDSGFIFQGATPLVGDISVIGMSFVSNNNAGTIVWDCNTIMRVSSSFNEYSNVDCVARQDSTVNMQLMQSMRFTNEKIIGGRGAAFLWQRASDCTFSNLLVENRGACFENIPDTGPDANMNQNFNVRITDCCIEGNVYGTAHTIKWGNSWCCTIARNYIENNTNYIDLHTLVRGSHKGLTFMGNVFFLSAAQKAAGFKPVVVGNLWTVSSTNYKAHTNLFAGNVSDGELYDFVGTGRMNTLGEYALGFTGFNNTRIAAISGSNVATTTGARSVGTYGITRKFNFVHTEANVNANEIRTIAIALSDADIDGIVNEATIYTVYPRQISTFSVLGISPVYSTATSGTLYITIQNRSAATSNVVLVINVLIPGN